MLILQTNLEIKAAHGQEPEAPISEANFAREVWFLTLNFLVNEAGSQFNRRVYVTKLLKDIARRHRMDFAHLTDLVERGLERLSRKRPVDASLAIILRAISKRNGTREAGGPPTDFRNEPNPDLSTAPAKTLQKNGKALRKYEVLDEWQQLLHLSFKEFEKIISDDPAHLEALVAALKNHSPGTLGAVLAASPKQRRISKIVLTLRHNAKNTGTHFFEDIFAGLEGSKTLSWVKKALSRLEKVDRVTAKDLERIKVELFVSAGSAPSQSVFAFLATPRPSSFLFLLFLWNESSSSKPSGPKRTEIRSLLRKNFSRLATGNARQIRSVLRPAFEDESGRQALHNALKMQPVTDLRRLAGKLRPIKTNADCAYVAEDWVRLIFFGLGVKRAKANQGAHQSKSEIYKAFLNELLTFKRSENEIRQKFQSLSARSFDREIFLKVLETVSIEPLEALVASLIATYRKEPSFFKESVTQILQQGMDKGFLLRELLTSSLEGAPIDFTEIRRQFQANTRPEIIGKTQSPKDAGDRRARLATSLEPIRPSETQKHLIAQFLESGTTEKLTIVRGRFAEQALFASVLETGDASLREAALCGVQKRSVVKRWTGKLSQANQFKIGVLMEPQRFRALVSIAEGLVSSHAAHPSPDAKNPISRGEFWRFVFTFMTQHKDQTWTQKKIKEAYSRFVASEYSTPTQKLHVRKAEREEIRAETRDLARAERALRHGEIDSILKNLNSDYPEISRQIMDRLNRMDVNGFIFRILVSRMSRQAIETALIKALPQYAKAVIEVSRLAFRVMKTDFGLSLLPRERKELLLALVAVAGGRNWSFEALVRWFFEAMVTRFRYRVSETLKSGSFSSALLTALLSKVHRSPKYAAQIERALRLLKPRVDREKTTKKAEVLQEAVKERRDALPEEAIGINNAGLVLVAPFLTAAYQELGFVKKQEDGKTILDDGEEGARAAHLLQFLATGESATGEAYLVLNKILIGLAVETPISAGIAIHEQEKLICDKILKSVLSNWKSLSTGTSVVGLREAFLNRPGRLTKRADHWQLHAERKTMDVLLEDIAWNFRMIFLPWMPQRLQVTW